MIEQSAPSANSLMIQYKAEWLIWQRAVLPSRVTLTSWRSGPQDHNEVQWGEVHQGEVEQEKFQSPTPEEEQPKAPVRAVHNPEGVLLDRKGPGFPAGHQVEHETSM